MTEIVIVASTYAELTGVGTEYVVRDGIVIAKFLNGDLESEITGNMEITK